MAARKFDEAKLAELLEKKDYDAITKMAGTAEYYSPDPTNATAKSLEAIFERDKSIVRVSKNNVIVEWGFIKGYYNQHGCLPEERIEALHDMGLLAHEPKCVAGMYGVFDGCNGSRENLGPWWLDICYPEFFARKEDAQAYAKAMYSGRICGNVYVTKIEHPSSETWYLRGNEGEEE